MVLTDEERTDPFAQAGVRHGYDRGPGNCRVAQQRILDFLCADILAAANDQILFAPGDANCALGA